MHIATQSLASAGSCRFQMFSKHRSGISVENMSGTRCIIMPTSDSVTCYYSWNNSRFDRKWTECIDKQWEGSRKPSGVRRQGASCPQPKYVSSNKYGGKKLTHALCKSYSQTKDVLDFLWSSPFLPGSVFMTFSKSPENEALLLVVWHQNWTQQEESLVRAQWDSVYWRLPSLKPLLYYPNSLNLINNTLIQQLHSWWDRVSRHFDGCLRGGLSY